MSKLVDDALIFATEKHAGQSHKYTGQPYIFSSDLGRDAGDAPRL